MSNIAGVDIGGISVKIGIVNDQGQVLVQTSFPSVHGDAPRMAKLISQAVQGLGYSLNAVGVGTAGRVWLADGLVTASNLGWRSEPLRDLLASSIGLPVYIDNDAQAALMHEWRSGVCRGLQDVVYLTFGTGIGGAMVLGGRPYRGNEHQGGEIGHMITHVDGEPCPCGQFGCYERYASVSALMRRLNDEEVPQFLQRLESGDSDAGDTFSAYLHEVAAGMATLERLLAPQMFVIGGGLSNAGALLLDGLTLALDKHMEHLKSRHRPAVTLAQARNNAGILGASAIARYYMAQK